jgi:hypothetical protein
VAYRIRERVDWSRRDASRFCSVQRWPQMRLPTAAANSGSRLHSSAVWRQPLLQVSYHHPGRSPALESPRTVASMRQRYRRQVPGHKR